MNIADLPLQISTSPSTPVRLGTQSLSKGIKLLRMVATRPNTGWRLSDLAVSCNQDKTTVHRMLTCFVDERFLEQRESDRHYLPGPLMYELGLALPNHLAFQRVVEENIAKCAHQLEGIVLFQFRSGNEYVCSVRAGTTTMTGAMVYPGTRRPLFTSAGGVAILQTLSPQEAHEVLADNVNHEIKRHGTSRLQGLQTMLTRSGIHGFGVNLGYVVAGAHAFGVPVCGKNASAFAAICLIGTPELYDVSRVDELRTRLVNAADELGAQACTFGIG